MKTIDWKSNDKTAKFFQMVGYTINNYYVISKMEGDTKFLVRIGDQKDRIYFDTIDLAKSWCESHINKN